MALVLEINEARSINLVIDNLLLLVRKVLNLLEGLSFSQGYLVSAESRNIVYISGPEIFKGEGEWTMNWLVVKVCKLVRHLWWVVDYRIQILNIIE